MYKIDRKFVNLSRKKTTTMTTGRQIIPSSGAATVKVSKLRQSLIESINPLLLTLQGVTLLLTWGTFVPQFQNYILLSGY